MPSVAVLPISLPRYWKKKNRRRVSAMKEDYEVQFSKLELRFFFFFPLI